MAILMIQDASAESLAIYDQIIKQLEATGHSHPPGRISHTAVRKGDGYLVADVWESQEALNQFFQQVLGPLMQQAGTSGGRGPEIYPVHNLIRDA